MRVVDKVAVQQVVQMQAADRAAVQQVAQMQAADRAAVQQVAHMRMVDKVAVQQVAQMQMQVAGDGRAWSASAAQRAPVHAEAPARLLCLTRSPTAGWYLQSKACLPDAGSSGCATACRSEASRRCCRHLQRRTLRRSRSVADGVVKPLDR
jgi:hypothetical protein